MDVMLKGDMMGTDAAEQIRRETGIPVIYLTANSNDSIFMKARETEPFGFILKPFEEAALRANIEIAIYKRRIEREREELVRKLQEALAQVKTLSGLMPICAWCKNVRSDKGYWQTVEQYIRDNSELTISHGVCPTCQKRFEAEVMAKTAKDKDQPPAT